MTVWDYRCQLCRKAVEDSPRDITGQPCSNPTCEGVLKRVYSFYLKPVAGGGGSKGHAVRGG